MVIITTAPTLTMITGSRTVAMTTITPIPNQVTRATMGSPTTTIITGTTANPKLVHRVYGAWPP